MATTLTVRLDDGIYAELSGMARAQGTTLSELTRRTLGVLVRPDDPESAPPGSGKAPTALTTLERHQLAMLHRILAHLVDGPGADGDYDHQIGTAEILENGYVGEYDDVFISIEPELSRSETGLVMDVLDMFTQLKFSYEQLNDSEQETLGERAAQAVQFGGFDLNHRLEGRLLTFARHLIAHGKWEPLAVYFDKEHERGNSHHPKIAMYERMLKEFNPLWREKIRAAVVGDRRSDAMSAEEIGRVVNAAVHPDNR